MEGMQESAPSFIQVISLLVGIYSVWISVKTMLAITATGCVAFVQLGAMTKATKDQATINVVINYLQDPEVREARRVLLDELRGVDYHPKEPGNSWQKNKRQAELVCSTYDLVGRLVANDVLQTKIILSGWHDSIVECYKAVEGMLADYRTRSGPDYYTGFIYLYEKAKKYKPPRRP